MAGCQEDVARSLDDKFLTRLSSHIGKPWMNLGRLLRVDNVRLETMRANNPGNLDEAVFQMLSCWRQESGTNATFQTLGRALEECKKHELASYVYEGKLPEVLPPSSGPMFDIDSQLKKDLRWFYSNKLCKIPLSPWEGQKIPIGEIYTNVQLLMNTPNPQEGQLQVPLESHHQLFSSEAKQRYGSRSILRGKAGSGKSTTVARLAHDWAEMDQNSPLASYDLLFVLRMRNMTPDQSFGDAILRQLLPMDSHYTKENLERLIRENEERVAIIFDGYDEYTSPADAASPHYVMDILRGCRLRHCCILVTMRPWKALESKEITDYTVYEVRGFSPQNVDHYILEKSFKNRPEMGQQLISYLEVNNLKESIACIPLLTSLLCHLWQSDPTVLDKPPTSLGELFSCLCACFQPGAKEDHPTSSSDDEGESSEDAEEVDEVNDLLEAMGPTALDGLFRDQQELTFLYPTLKSALGRDVLHKGKKTGLLIFEEKLSFKTSLKSKLSRARRKKAKRVSFYHKSIQEYCAGIHLARVLEINEEKFRGYVLEITSVLRAIDLSYVLLFASWKSLDAARAILTVLVNIFQKELEPKTDGFFQGSLGLRECHQMQKFFELCLHINYESQSEGSLNEQLQFVHSCGCVRLVGISTYTAEALAYYLNYVTESQVVDSLELIQLSMQSTTSIRELGRHFPSAERLHTTYMQVYTRKTTKELEGLRDSCMPKVTTKSLQGMEHWNNYEFVSKFHLVQVLEDWQSSRTNLCPVLGAISNLQLTKLVLTGQQHLGKSVSLLRDALESGNLSNLRCLNLSHCEMTEMETELLARSLCNLRELEELNLANNDLGKEFGGELAKLNKIKTLVLEGTLHNAEVTKTFVKAFESLPHLSYLEFRHNTMDEDGARIFTNSLRQLRCLQALRFSSSDLPFDVFPELLEVIGKLEELKNLQVLHIAQPNEVLCYLARILPSLSKIEDLRISGFKDGAGNYVMMDESEVMELAEKLCELRHLRMFSLLQVRISLPLLTRMIESFTDCKSSNFEIFRISRKLVTPSHTNELFNTVKFLRLW